MALTTTDERSSRGSSFRVTKNGVALPPAGAPRARGALPQGRSRSLTPAPVLNHRTVPFIDQRAVESGGQLAAAFRADLDPEFSLPEPSSEDRQAIAQAFGLEDPLYALLIAPARYDDYRNLASSLEDASRTGRSSLFTAKVMSTPDGEPCIRGFAAKGEQRTPKSGYMEGTNPNKRQLVNPFEWPVRMLEIDIIDEQGQQGVLSVFGAVREWRDIPAGKSIVLRGLVQRYGRRLFVKSPEWVQEGQIGEIHATYVAPGGIGVNGAQISSLINWVLSDEGRTRRALELACNRIREDCGQMSDAQILELCSPVAGGPAPIEDLPALLASLHRPQNTTLQGNYGLSIAQSICALAQQCLAVSENTRAPCPAAPIASKAVIDLSVGTLIKQYEQRSGFKLTSNQRQIVLQAAARMAEQKPLNGLLNGEVGAGKTAVFSILSALVYSQRGSAIILAPTELLADQHAQRLAAMFGPQVAIERVRAGRKIKNPGAVLVGTAGLASAAQKADIAPALLVLDEQHKLPTAIRQALVAAHTHILEVTATPIPRTMALSVYKGMDVFMLNEQPVMREIETSLTDNKQIKEVQAQIARCLSAGSRGAMVLSLVSAKSASTANRTSLEKAAAGLDALFPGKISVLHGKMKDDEKLAALERFRSGEQPFLVTTSIFETGIDVPDVRLLIIRDPDCLGLSQLHQLRGRLARNGGRANCILLASDVGRYDEKTLERLQTFTRENDGYRLAQHDLLTRDIGDLAGTAQSGHAGQMTFKAIGARGAQFAMDESEAPKDKIALASGASAKANSAQASSSSKNQQRQTSLF